MEFVFDIDKAVAVAAYLTTKCGGNKGISVFLLIKMMYAAERRALAEWHRPITGDSFVSMEKGPVLSRTYDLIKGTILSSNSDMVKWSRYFSPRDGNNIRLIDEPDLDYLSEMEVGALDNAATEIMKLMKKYGKVVDVLHERWPEWKDPTKLGRGCVPLSVKEVLSEIIEDESEVERIVLEIRAVASAKAALQISNNT